MKKNKLDKFRILKHNKNSKTLFSNLKDQYRLKRNLLKIK